MSAPPSSKARVGLACGVGAFAWWGLAPLYFKAVGHIYVWEVLAHRVVWSLAFLAVVVTGLRRWRGLPAALADPKVLRALAISTLLIGLNWSLYIHAVDTNRVMEASFGYFITPLVNVALGVAFLGERLRRLQGLGIALAVIGVVILAATGHGLPWIALVLAVSFGCYGLARKTAPIDGLLGLLVETAALAPVALAYLTWREVHGHGAFTAGASDALWLAASGLVTSVPLIAFVVAARRLTMATIGVLQYIGPTVQFLLAVLVFDEPFMRPQAVSFAFIWSAVVLYTIDSVRSLRATAAARQSATDLANTGHAQSAIAQLELTPDA
jgi:chloramphenicol-sensitive protein RarD